MRKGRNDGRRGSQLVEGALMLTPLLGLAFFMFDAGWALFVKATLEHAVHEGVRYAVTGQTAGGNGQMASIMAVVQDQAMGLLSGDAASSLSVTFLDATTLAPVASNMGGNIVQVSVTNYPFKPMVPLLHSAVVVPITVSAADRLESSPGGVPPPM